MKFGKYLLGAIAVFAFAYGAPNASAQCPGGKCPSVIQGQIVSPFTPQYRITPQPVETQQTVVDYNKQWTSLATGKTLYEHSDGVFREYPQGSEAKSGNKCDGKCPCDREKDVIKFPVGPTQKK